jgi:hypothetical protein
LTGGGSLFGTSQSADGTFTQYVVILGDNNKIKFRGANFNGSITSISLVEVGQDWTLGTGWSIGEDKAVADTTGNFVNLYQNSVFVVGKTYKTTFSIADYTQGKVRLTQGGVDVSGFQNAVGTYTTYFTATQTSLYMQGSESFIGSVTNISVKEVGQNWTLSGVDFSIGSVFFNNSTENIFQNSGYFTSGTKYKLTFDGSGDLAYRTGFAGADGTRKQITLPHTAYITATADTNRIQPYGANGNLEGTLTNISVIEITDDTNLPRINYEGFSYQDALGSELVTNGDFATDSDWNLSSATIEDGKLTLNSVGGGGAYAYQTSLNIVANTTYLITFDATRISGDTNLAFTFGAGNNVSGSPIISTSGAKSYYFTPTVNFNNFGLKRNFGGSGAVWEVENFSIKEYLGQEVVPDSGCGSWLWENQSTNLIPYSENFNTWNNLGSRSIITLNSIISPDGTLNGTKQTQNAVSNSVRLRFSSILTIGTEYTFSVFAKKGNYDKLQMNISGVTTNFTLTDNWARYEITVTAPNNTFVDVGIPSGSIGDFIYLWGAQAEEQSYATSYIPTNGTSVTRNKDLCNNGGTGTGLINSTEGVLYAEIAANSDDLTGRVISLSDGTSNERIVLSYNNSTNKIRCFIKSGGSFFATLDKVVADEKQFHKVAYKYKSGETKLFVDGNLVDTSTDAFTITGLDVLQFANGTTTTQPFFGKTKCLAVWKETLSDEELAELTTI